MTAEPRYLKLFLFLSICTDLFGDAIGVGSHQFGLFSTDFHFEDVSLLEFICVVLIACQVELS